MPELSLRDRALGAYLGVAVGDALGATVEFMTVSEIKAEYGVHRHMTGGGWLRLKPGQVTDDTGMCMALAGAILQSDGWDLRTAADAFVAWMASCPVDIGNTCRRGIRRYMFDGTFGTQPREDQAGNGALMRNLPVVLSTLDDENAFIERSRAQAHITHSHALSDAAILATGRLTRLLLAGGSLGECRHVLDELIAVHPQFRFEPWPGRTSGYVVDTLQTVLHALFRTDSFEALVVEVVNRGGDADTTGAIAGQLGGALYGVAGIPKAWLKQLNPAISSAIRRQTEGLLALSSRSPTPVSSPKASSAAARGALFGSDLGNLPLPTTR